MGRYRFASDESFVTVTGRAGRLFYQADGKAGFEIYPTAPREFFMKAYGLKLRFAGSGAEPADAVEVGEGSARATAMRV